MKLLAIVGQPGSGKDTAAKYLSKKYKLRHIATGDILRDYIVSNQLGGLDRANMQKVVSHLRQEKGDAVLADIAIDTIKPNEDILISGLRHPAEGKKVVEGNGHILAIVAPVEIRYERAIVRGREGENISLDEFKRLENNENKGSSFNINDLIKNADFTITNEKGYEDFLTKLDSIMIQLGISEH